jgi:hypothetical protein
MRLESDATRRNPALAQKTALVAVFLCQLACAIAARPSPARTVSGEAWLSGQRFASINKKPACRRAFCFTRSPPGIISGW